MWKKIKEVFNNSFKLLDAIAPIVYLIVILSYLYRDEYYVKDTMWFSFFLLTYCTNQITDAIKETKDKDGENL